MPKARRPARKAAARKTATAGRARPQPRRAVRRDGDTERRILDAARRVFVRRGSAGARMQEIAAEAGVNQALLHYYFRSKDALALAVLREAAGRVFPGLLQILGSSEPLERRIELVVHHYIDALRDHPFLPGYVLAEMNFDPERIPAIHAEMFGPDQAPRVQATLARIERDVAERVANGVIRPMTAHQFMVNVTSLCVFPFAARPMLGFLYGISGPEWDRFLDQRRVELPMFILNALRP